MGPFFRLLGLSVIGVSRPFRFWVLNALVILAWVGVATADPPQASKGSSPEDLEATTQRRKEIEPGRSVAGRASARPPTSRVGRSSLVLTPEKKKEIREIAGMIVSQAPEHAIRSKTSAYIGAYMKMASQTEGAEARADQVSVKAVQDEVQKEIWESEQQKAEQLTEAQREQIRKMLKMVEEMMKRQADQFDTKLSQ